MRESRSIAILRLLEERTNVRVPELSAQLRVSEATIRRDLDRLRRQGRLRRVRGGALQAGAEIVDLSVKQRCTQQSEQKQRIGRAAANLIQDGETVFIGSGTTTLEVARNLGERSGLTVITNAHTVVDALARNDNVAVISTGGLLRHSELSFVGHLTQRVLGELRPQKVVIGIRALNLESGLTSDYLPEITTDQDIIAAGPTVILVADHTKLGQVSTALVAPITAIHTLVTDDLAPPEFVDAIRKLGIGVVIA